MNEQIRKIPAVALRGLVILPSMVLHFDVSREKSVKAIEKAMLGEQQLFVVTQKEPEAVDPQMQDLYCIGTVVVVKQVVRLPGGLLRVLVEGMERAECVGMECSQGYLEAEIRILPEQPELLSGYEDEIGQKAMVRTLQELFQDYAAVNRKMSRELVRQVLNIGELAKLVEQISIHLPLEYTQKQKLLEAGQMYERYELLCIFLGNEINILQIKEKLQEKVKERIDKNQREYILREQLKIIREELGEDTVQSDAEQFRQKLETLEASAEIKEKIEKEIRRFQGMAGNVSESSVLKGYIETLLEMPWDKAGEDRLELEGVKAQLDADHYGLWKVKERILEYLAVRMLTKKCDSPILCLVGPPGTGKTSIAKSIADALGKKYVRVCLGGVRDEAEIRGHRRTYVGAMPGRIAVGMRMAGVKNPLMLLDEIDKVSSDYKGDTSAALLEVLDPEQNCRFRDHYIELPVDLSQVLFLATANDAHNIPRPLLDRMEVIEMESYTENEKLHIAKEHLMKKQLERHGLENARFTMTDQAWKRLIGGYTREAGVRELERQFAKICRKSARELLEKKKQEIRITGSSLVKYLGKERFLEHRRNEKNEPGIVCGLAWTSVGGDILQIETNAVPGKGELHLTGQLGDVMKESARAGITYIRSVGGRWNIEEDYFQTHDIHIHIPEGAVPKDGPSAGVTMATAVLSAVTGIPVYAAVAMTGEITLRGRVLPIGGLKEKLLAAHHAGIGTVLVPEKNRMDVEEIASEIKKGLDIRFVSTMDEVLEYAFVKEQEDGHDH